MNSHFWKFEIEFTFFILFAFWFYLANFTTGINRHWIKAHLRSNLTNMNSFRTPETQKLSWFLIYNNNLLCIQISNANTCSIYKSESTILIQFEWLLNNNYKKKAKYKDSEKRGFQFIDSFLTIQRNKLERAKGTKK